MTKLNYIEVRILGWCQDETYGLDIFNGINEIFKKLNQPPLSYSRFYRSLKRLQSEGYINGRSLNGQDSKKIYYSLSQKGKQAHLVIWKSLTKNRLNNLTKHQIIDIETGAIKTKQVSLISLIPDFRKLWKWG